jgi:hypothetical protein
MHTWFSFLLKFPAANLLFLVLKQGDALSALVFDFALEYANTKVQENRQAFGSENGTSASGLR